MALQSSGPLKISEIESEFGGTPPTSISEYYRGGGLVPVNTSTVNIPESGIIKFSDFYSLGVENTYVFNNSLNWSYDSNSQTFTKIPGSTVDLNPVVLTTSNTRFFSGVTPDLPFTFYGSGTQRVGDLSIISFVYSTTNQDPTKLNTLTITIRDIDFANADQVPGGITQNTIINIGAPTYDNSGPTPSAGKSVWYSGNYSQYISGTSGLTITNNTGATIYLKLKISNSLSGPSSISATFDTLSAIAFQGQEVLSSNYKTILNGNSITFNWSISGGTSLVSGWAITFGYRYDTPTNTTYSGWESIISAS